MTIHKWCERAKMEQVGGYNHLHANFRHSAQQHLLPPDALGSFAAGLDAAMRAGAVNLKQPPEIRVAAAAVEEASEERFKTLPLLPDFRFLGPPIPVAAGDLFVNVVYWPEPDSATGSGPLVANRDPHRVVWLTVETEVITVLKRVQSTVPTADLSDMDFFRELIHGLGLKANSKESVGGRYECTLRLGRVTEDGALRRPHALSTGYDDRFCGESPYSPYGSTADNRTGEAGFPEAICPSGKVELLTDGADYEDLRKRLIPFASWIGRQPGPIRASLDGDDLFAINAPYDPQIQGVIIDRLSEKRAGCQGPPNYCVCRAGGVS